MVHFKKIGKTVHFFPSNFDVERGIRSLFVYFALSFISYVLRVLLSITMSNHVYVPERGREKSSENNASVFQKVCNERPGGRTDRKPSPKNEMGTFRD